MFSVSRNTFSDRLSGVTRALCAAAFLAAVGVYLFGCNTVKGLGRDVEAVAQGGQDIIDGKH